MTSFSNGTLPPGLVDLTEPPPFRKLMEKDPLQAALAQMLVGLIGIYTEHDPARADRKNRASRPGLIALLGRVPHFSFTKTLSTPLRLYAV